MGKLWGGRFSGDIDAQFAQYNASYPFDRRLFEADIRGSIAYAKGLQQANLLTDQEHDTLCQALEALLQEAIDEPAFLDKGLHEGAEDVHSFVEAELIQRVGDVGRKLHTGRSRNDQVATDLRLYMRDAVDQILHVTATLQHTLLDLADAHPEVALPGYTHLQKAQPVLFAHFLLSYFEMLQRDRIRLHHTREAINHLPLGSAAMAGTSYPIDRNLLAQLLDFAQPTHNSMDAVSDRDFALDFLHAANLIMMHLSRLAEDFIIYASTEFKFIEMSDLVATGSSIMPQKKNPDALELIRGKMGRVLGAYTGLSTTLKGLPLCYNKDLQEDKEPLFDTIDTLLGSLGVMNTVLSTLQVNHARMQHAAKRDYLNATELADYLARKQIPFREAHEVVGKVVLYAISEQKQLEELSLQEYQQHHPQFEEDIYEAISLEATLAKKNVPGGTAPQQVQQALKHARERLNTPLS